MAIDHIEGPLPSSAPLERDARLVSTDHKVEPSEIAIGVIIGRAAEYFDFFVFAIASVVVFPKVFFPFAEPVTATLYSFAVFSLAFVARPIGSVVFMAVDRRHGRGVKLTIALFLLGFSTMAVSFLPGYAQIGAWSLYLLGILRIGQGLALGGAWDGLASLLALNAPIERRGFYAAIPQLGAPLGFMVAGVLFAFFLLNLSEADFLDWGWRYPFFCAFAVNVVALFSRLRLVATDEFARLLERGRLEPSPIIPLIRNHAPELLVGALIPLASFALFHLVTVFPISWITLFTQRSAGEFLMVQCSGALICAGAVIASGLVTQPFAAMLPPSGRVAGTNPKLARRERQAWLCGGSVGGHRRQGVATRTWQVGVPCGIGLRKQKRRVLRAVFGSLEPILASLAGGCHYWRSDSRAARTRAWNTRDGSHRLDFHASHPQVLRALPRDLG